MKTLWSMLFMLGTLFAALADDVPTINAWGGRSQRLPFEASQGWTVESLHGRPIRQSTVPGPVSVPFPAVTGKETVVLSVDGEVRARIVLHPEKLLAGVVADCRCRREELEALGVTHCASMEADESPACVFADASMLSAERGQATEEEGKKFASTAFVLFSARRDFPLKFGDEWGEISLGLDKKKGTLGVIMDRREQTVDHSDGGIAWVVARRRDGAKIILLPPEFDLNDIDSILFLKRELTK